MWLCFKGLKKNEIPAKCEFLFAAAYLCCITLSIQELVCCPSNIFFSQAAALSCTYLLYLTSKNPLHNFLWPLKPLLLNHFTMLQLEIHRLKQSTKLEKGSFPLILPAFLQPPEWHTLVQRLALALAFCQSAFCTVDRYVLLLDNLENRGPELDSKWNQSWPERWWGPLHKWFVRHTHPRPQSIPVVRRSWISQAQIPCRIGLRTCEAQGRVCGAFVLYCLERQQAWGLPELLASFWVRDALRFIIMSYLSYYLKNSIQALALCREQCVQGWYNIRCCYFNFN